jgi:tRNA(Ile)-lysidine synthetase-like protein
MVRLAVRAGDGLSAAAGRRAAWAPTGWAIEARSLRGQGASAQLPMVDREWLPPGLDPDRLSVDLAEEGPFLVRARLDGDRIRTPGGSRTVADLMSEAGVPRALRALLPLVVRAHDGTVLWVPGIAVVEDARVGPHSGRATDAATADHTRLVLDLLGP